MPMPIPAAQYLRMSTDDQQYSLANQRIRISEYAQKQGFNIIKTYEDPGRSGVIIKHRKGLSALLSDVVSGEAKFRAVLVYDVSRWGRFQNPDEAAHYEFLCASAGIPLHYCAEQFNNDGTASSAILKALKHGRGSSQGTCGHKIDILDGCQWEHVYGDRSCTDSQWIIAEWKTVERCNGCRNFIESQIHRQQQLEPAYLSPSLVVEAGGSSILDNEATRFSSDCRSTNV